MSKMTPAKKLKEISNLIIPTLEIFESDGERVFIDRSLYSVITSCLNDLKENKNDELTQKSLEECLLVLDKVHDLLEYKRLPDGDVSDIKAILVDFKIN